MLSAEGTGGLVLLSGPSCVGKSPLAKALRRFHPDLSAKLQPIVLYNSRSPRPGERDGEDYHFRPREQIEALRDRERYVVMDVRGDLQALDLEDLSALLNKGDAFFEGNPFIGRTLQTHPDLRGLKRLGVFLSPLSREEILFLRDEAHVSLPDLVAEVMRRKLLRRAHRQKTDLSLKDLEEIERRAGSAYRELKEAHHFEYVIPTTMARTATTGRRSIIRWEMRAERSLRSWHCCAAKAPRRSRSGRRICCLDTRRRRRSERAYSGNADSRSSTSGVPRSAATCSSAFQARLLGRTRPFSQRLTVENVTPSACARASCVSPER